MRAVEVAPQGFKEWSRRCHRISVLVDDSVDGIHGDSESSEHRGRVSLPIYPSLEGFDGDQGLNKAVDETGVAQID